MRIRGGEVYLSLSEVRSMLGVSQGTIQKLKSSGSLGEYRYAAYNDYPATAVLNYIEKVITETGEKLSALRNARKQCKRILKAKPPTPADA